MTYFESITAFSEINIATDTIQRPDNATEYAAGDVVNRGTAAILSFSNIAVNPGAIIEIIEAGLMIDVPTVPSGMIGFRLHLYSAAPAIINDNVAYNLPQVDRSKYLGYIQFDLTSSTGVSVVETPLDLTDTLYYQSEQISKIAKLANASTTLYGVLQTLGGYVPNALSTMTITLYAKEV